MNTQYLLDKGFIYKYKNKKGYYKKGELYLSGCTSLISLPSDLKVEKGLNLKFCTSLTSLPDGLQVGWSLDLYGCTSLTSLPSDLIIGSSLDLSGCTSLRSIPADLKVKRYLYLEGCTLYPFDTTKFDIEGDYKIVTAVHYIMED